MPANTQVIQFDFPDVLTLSTIVTLAVTVIGVIMVWGSRQRQHEAVDAYRARLQYFGLVAFIAVLTLLLLLCFDMHRECPQVSRLREQLKSMTAQLGKDVEVITAQQKQIEELRRAAK